MRSHGVLREMYGTLLGALLLVLLILTLPEALAGLEQTALPEGATERVWKLVTDEALTLGLVMAAGICSALGMVGLARLVRRKPKRSHYGPDEGYSYNAAYDDWHLFMQRVATYGGLVWIFALEMVALKVMASERYGLTERIIVALTPALIGCFLVSPAYNYAKEKGRKWGLIATPVDTDGDGIPDTDDETRKL